MPEDVSRDELFLRLYPERALLPRRWYPRFPTCGLAELSSRQRSPVDDTALRIALPESLAPGQQTEIALQFVTTVPKVGAGYGIFGVANGVYSLYN